MFSQPTKTSMVRAGQDAGSAAALRERGDMSLMVGMSIPLFFAIVAFVVDCMMGYDLWSHENNTISAAREACMAPTFALQVKNSDNPAQDIADRVVDHVRTNAIDGAITVWVYEVPEKDLPPSKRLLVVGVQIEDQYYTKLACGFGLNSFPVATHLIFSINPYSETKTWRPQASGNGTYSIDAGAPQSAMTYAPGTALANYPTEIVDEVQARIGKINA